MYYLSRKEFRKLLVSEMHDYQNRCASVLPIGSLCIVNKPHSTKVYRVYKHYPPGTRKKYQAFNKRHEVQVQCVLNLCISSTKPAKHGLTSYPPEQLRCFDIITMGSLRSKIDDLLRSCVNGG